MAKPNECYAYFTVRDDALDPHALTQELGVAPTEAWAKGDFGPRGRERRLSSWKLRSRLPDSAELEDHVRDVLLQMDARAEAFADVSRRLGGLMQLVGYFHEVGMGLHFPKELAARLAYYGLALDFDFYYLYSDAREDTD